MAEGSSKKVSEKGSNSMLSGDTEPPLDDAHVSCIPHSLRAAVLTFVKVEAYSRTLKGSRSGCLEGLLA